MCVVLALIPTSNKPGVYFICELYRYLPLWRVWFSSSSLYDRVYESECLGLEEGIIFQETDQLVEDFI